MIRRIINIVLCCMAVVAGASAGAQTKAPSLENLRINGMLMYDNNRSEDVLGFYEYSATAPVTRRPIVLSPRNYLAGDAVVVDGKLYTYHLDVQYGYVNSAFYTIIDVATGVASKSSNISYELGTAYSHKATSAALNPVDGKVYCSGYEYADNTLTPTLKIWDVKANSKEAVGTMEASLAVMSFDKDGNLYGITASSSQSSDDGGRLVKVNTATGALTLVGDTGVRPWFDQSGVISPYDGLLYWFVNEPVAGGGANDADAALYTVNLATAAATRIGELPEGDEVVAAWIPAQTISDNAPGVATGLTTAFEAPSLSGKVKFTMPSTSYSGGALSGTLAWAVSCEGSVLATGEAAAGSEAAADVTVSRSGSYTFDVTVSSDEGTSEIVQTSAYIGYGMPKAVNDVKFAVENGEHVVTWAHVTELDAGSWLDGEHASYRIVRQPGNVLLQEKWTADRFTEPALDGEMQSTYYEISAVNGDLSSAATHSNAIVTGSAAALPFHEDFADASALDLFTIIDGNKDKTTWSYYSYSKVVQIRQTTSGTQDDWLVLPPVKLTEGYSYDLKFTGYATVATYINTFDVAIGASPEALTELVAEGIEVTDARSTTPKETTVTIKPNVTGVYNIGIHIVSASRQGTFSISEISVSAGQSTAIPAAPGLTAEAAAKGALGAKLTIVAPTVTAGGAELTNAVTSYEIERDGTPLAVVNAAAGAETVYEDDTMTAAGTYEYTVYAVNADGKGEKAAATVFVGRDRPFAPEGFKAVDNFDGSVSLSWNAPVAEGVNGGYVDTEHLVYTVTAPDKTVTEGISGTSATAAIDRTGTQKEVTYVLGVKYDDDSELAQTVESNSLIAGAPYTLPFAENFNDADARSAVWVKDPVKVEKSYNLEFTLTATDSNHSGTGSGMKIYSYEKEAVGRWISPAFDLSQAIKPEITLWVNMSAPDLTFELQVQEAYGEWQTIARVEPVSEWTELTVDLSDYRSKFVRLGFTALFNGWYTGLYVDDIAISENTSGIEGVTVEDAATEIYNLQGLRVTDTSAPGIYIIRRGSEVRKVVK